MNEDALAHYPYHREPYIRAESARVRSLLVNFEDCLQLTLKTVGDGSGQIL